MRTASPITRSSSLRRERSRHPGRARERITSRRAWRRDGPAHETRVTLGLRYARMDCAAREAAKAAGREQRDHALAFAGRGSIPSSSGDAQRGALRRGRRSASMGMGKGRGRIAIRCPLAQHEGLTTHPSARSPALLLSLPLAMSDTPRTPTGRLVWLDGHALPVSGGRRPALD